MLLRIVALLQSNRIHVAAVAVGLAVLLGACSSTTPTPGPTQTASPTPTVRPTPTSTPVPTPRPTISFGTPTPTSPPSPTATSPEGEHILFLNGIPVTASTIAFPETQVSVSEIPGGTSNSYRAGTAVTLSFQTTLEELAWAGDAAQCGAETTCDITLDSDKRIELGSGGLPVFISELDLKGALVQSRVPSQVQFTFSLRDQNDHAVVLPSEAIQARTHIYERLNDASDWEEIDYSETSFFAHTAENFALDVVFVLDFSNSVAQARLSDGRTGTTAIFDALETAIEDLPRAHRIGVVEFHDRSFVPSVLANLTSDRDSLLNEVSEFVTSVYDPGSSRVWDAIDAALELLPAADRRVRSIVFLSDGRDTSSTNDANSVISRANDQDVSLYPVGIGDVAGSPTLVSIAEQTGGTYYQAPRFDELEQLLEQITNDLKGQYKVSYNTLRTEGTYEVRVDVGIGGAVGTSVSRPIDLAGIFGADNVGQLVTDPPAFDTNNNETVIFIRALHVPRNVTHLRLRLITNRNVRAALVDAGNGGLLSGWSMETPDENGWVTVTSATPLAFGNFGLLLKFTVEGIDPGDLLGLEIDNSGYEGQKSFNDATPSSITGSCAALQGLLVAFPIQAALRLQADTAVHIGIDEVCEALIVPILEGGILAPTPTPSPTPIPNNEWVNTGSLPLARSHAATVVLNDGTAMVIGGRFANSEAVASVDRYDPETSTWTTESTLKTPRESATATTLLDGRVLVVGGRTNATATGMTSAETFEPLTNTWTSLAEAVGGGGNTAKPRLGHTATLLNDGRVLIVGGELGSGADVSAEIFDPGFSTFSQVEGVDFAREDHAAVLMPDGTVLIVGSKEDNVRVVERFDPTTDSFSPAGVLRESYFSLTATLLPDGSVLIVGTSPSISAQAEIFSPDGTSRLITAPGSLLRTIAVIPTPTGGYLYIGPDTSFGPNVSPDDTSIVATHVGETPVDGDGAAWFRLGNGEIFLLGDTTTTTIWRFAF